MWIMHPRVERLYVNNYRCFVNFELRPEGRSLLLGYNGTGKSSVFDVLGAIQDVVVNNVDVSEAFPADTLAKFTDSREQRFEIDIESEFGLFRYALLLVYEQQHDVLLIKSEEVLLNGKPLYRFSESTVQLYRDDHQPAKETFPFSPRRSFLASLEPKPFNKRIIWFLKFVESIWVVRVNPARMTSAAGPDARFLERDGSNFASWCRYLLEEAPDSVQRAQEALRAIIPGFVSLRMQAAGRSKILVTKFSPPGGSSYELDFDCLSDGQRVLIVLYVLLHAVVEAVGVLGLDEPDNFVSIREIQPFLVELADLRDEKGVQSFLISHSSEVIDYIGPSGAILLERPDGGHTRVGTLTAVGSLRLSELMARGWHDAS